MTTITLLIAEETERALAASRLARDIDGCRAAFPFETPIKDVNVEDYGQEFAAAA